MKPMRYCHRRPPPGGSPLKPFHNFKPNIFWSFPSFRYEFGLSRAGSYCKRQQYNNKWRFVKRD